MKISAYTSSESLCKWIFEFAEFGIILTDTELNITDVNRWIENKTGKERLNLAGNSILEVFPEIRERGMEQYLRNAVAGASVILSARFHNFLIRLPVTGSDEPEQMKQTVRISALTENSSVYGLIIHIEDVSERFRNEELMRKKNEELQKLSITKDRFFRIISHDLRSPFSAMLGFSQLLRDDKTITSEHARNHISILYSAIKKQFDYLENLLKWVRIQSGGFELVFTDINLSSLVGNVLETAAPLLESKKIEIKTSCVPENLIINTDKQALMTILYNLVLNAIKFTAEEGFIELCAFMHDDFVLISVRDTGIGIPEDRLSKLFSIDESVSTPGTNNESGSGLGLLLVKDLLNIMKGSIVVESTPGQGSVFKISLPQRIE